MFENKQSLIRFGLAAVSWLSKGFFRLEFVTKRNSSFNTVTINQLTSLLTENTVGITIGINFLSETVVSLIVFDTLIDSKTTVRSLITINKSWRTLVTTIQYLTGVGVAFSILTILDLDTTSNFIVSIEEDFIRVFSFISDISWFTRNTSKFVIISACSNFIL
jgi:hypothetical protein